MKVTAVFAAPDISHRSLLRRSLSSTSSEVINYSNEIAIRKLEELDRETVDDVVQKIPEFLSQTYKNADKQAGESTMHRIINEMT